MQGFGTGKAHLAHMLQDGKGATIEGEGSGAFSVDLRGPSARILRLRVEHILRAYLLMIPYLIEQAFIPSLLCNLWNVPTLHLSLEIVLNNGLPAGVFIIALVLPSLFKVSGVLLMIVMMEMVVVVVDEYLADVHLGLH